MKNKLVVKQVDARSGRQNATHARGRDKEKEEIGRRKIFKELDVMDACLIDSHAHFIWRSVTCIRSSDGV